MDITKTHFVFMFFNILTLGARYVKCAICEVEKRRAQAFEGTVKGPEERVQSGSLRHCIATTSFTSLSLKETILWTFSGKRYFAKMRNTTSCYRPWAVAPTPPCYDFLSSNIQMNGSAVCFSQTSSLLCVSCLFYLIWKLLFRFKKRTVAVNAKRKLQTEPLTINIRHFCLLLWAWIRRICILKNLWSI